MDDFADSKFSKLISFEKGIIEGFDKYIKEALLECSKEELVDHLLGKKEVAIEKTNF